MDEIQKLAKGLTYKEIIICKLLRDTESKGNNKSLITKLLIHFFLH